MENKDKPLSEKIINCLYAPQRNLKDGGIIIMEKQTKKQLKEEMDKARDDWANALVAWKVWENARDARDKAWDKARDARDDWDAWVKARVKARDALAKALDNWAKARVKSK